MIKKLLILINLLLIPILVKGQNFSVDFPSEMVYLMKKEIYKSIIHSTYLQSDKEYHLVTIPNTALDMKYTAGIKSFLYDIKEVPNDTVSVHTLREELPANYYIYADGDEQFVKNLKGEEYLNSFLRSDTSQILINQDWYHNKNSYDIIRIIEPFDKWFSIYKSSYTNSNDVSTVLTVKHEFWDDTLDIIKKKYFLFLLKLNNSEFEIIDSVFIEN